MKLFCVVISSSPHWVNVIAESESQAREEVNNFLGGGKSRLNFWPMKDFEIECVCEDVSKVLISGIERG